MNLERMLEKCRRDQWQVGDLNWRRTPRPLSRADEELVVQYFTNMTGIERMAGALFHVQARKATDPVLQEIFQTFVIDEVRHAQVAQMLADFYDVHRYRVYQLNPHLVRFHTYFVDTIRHLSAEIANVYIITGELLLDIALLRSLDDYVDDEMSHEAMALINRDESRHVAIDFHMVEYYSSEAYDRQRAREPRPTPLEEARAWWSLVNMMYFAAPFLREVFFEPLDAVDPSGRRMLEAFKRIQLLGTRPRVARRPFVLFMQNVQKLFNHPVIGPLFGPVLLRVLGTDPRTQAQLYTHAERERAARMSFEELAEEALALKFVS